ncbi:MAG: phosphate uptake regulator PhoU [Planctomycetota bacterium]
MAGEAAQSGGFVTKLELIRGELNAQGRRVVAICDAAFDAFFSDDPAAAKKADAMDDEIDRADIAIEQQAVRLLCDAAREANELPPEQIRELLVVVKANNELERIADCAVHICEHVSKRSGAEIPETFRVLSNSVIGIVRDVCRSLEMRDAETAKLVLKSEDTVRGFKAAVLRDAESRLASGDMAVDTAFLLHELASCCEHIADHSTNMAEQVLYAVTGTIVRHCEAGWREVSL